MSDPFREPKEEAVRRDVMSDSSTGRHVFLHNFYSRVHRAENTAAGQSTPTAPLIQLEGSGGSGELAPILFDIVDDQDQRVMAKDPADELFVEADSPDSDAARESHHGMFQYDSVRAGTPKEAVLVDDSDRAGNPGDDMFIYDYLDRSDSDAESDVDIGDEYFGAEEFEDRGREVREDEDDLAEPERVDENEHGDEDSEDSEDNEDNEMIVCDDDESEDNNASVVLSIADQTQVKELKNTPSEITYILNHYHRLASGKLKCVPEQLLGTSPITM